MAHPRSTYVPSSSLARPGYPCRFQAMAAPTITSDPASSAPFFRYRVIQDGAVGRGDVRRDRPDRARAGGGGHRAGGSRVHVDHAAHRWDRSAGAAPAARCWFIRAVLYQPLSRRRYLTTPTTAAMARMTWYTGVRNKIEA